LIAIFIIYFVLVFHYKKISLANLTLASTVLCFFGAAFGIWVTRFEFGMTSVLGFVCLIGIVMRNGIILFDYADKLRKNEKMTVKEAALEAGKRRMRPIVLTSVAASVGVITMLVVEASGDQWQLSSISEHYSPWSLY
jgi:multidrug efflux pump subunit AcrB